MKHAINSALLASRQRLQARSLVSYRLRDPETLDIFGDDFPNEQLAADRARELVELHGRPVEICHVIAGRIVQSDRSTANGG
jgi:hypothetical protein